MTQLKLLRAMQHYIANISISGSTLRNQGAAGVVGAARRFLAKLDLSPLISIRAQAYAAWLDARTDALLRRFPRKARRWGAARKAINIFMVQAAMNGRLAAAYRLNRLTRVMETPLDRVAAYKLRQCAGERVLPRWPGVARLTPEISMTYQDYAACFARRKRVPRGCLDVILWLPASAGGVGRR